MSPSMQVPHQLKVTRPLSSRVDSVQLPTMGETIRHETLNEAFREAS
jgi:hypothetical protein